MLRNRKAQAILELAVLGSLIIMAFSIAIQHSEQSNREQSYMQQTFRAALKAAKTANSSAQWETIDFRRMSNVTNPMELGNVTNPMELGELQQFSSSNNVLWSDGKKDADTGEPINKPKSWFQLNRGSPVEIPPRAQLPFNVSETSHTSYTSNANVTTTFQKNEYTDGQIITHKSLVATDSISGSADISGTTVDLGSSLGEGGKYTGGGINRSESMQ